MYQDAVDEATEALRLDRLTPHRDKKLPEAGSRTSRGPDPDVEGKCRQECRSRATP